MITNMFSVLDSAVKAFLPPFFCRTKGEAIRSFSEAANNKEHQFYRHSADYTLYYLGDFDDASGIVTSTMGPERVISAREVIETDDIFPPEKRVAS